MGITVDLSGLIEQILPTKVIEAITDERVVKAAKVYIQEADKMQGMSGEEKRTYVADRLQEELLKLGMGMLSRSGLNWLVETALQAVRVGG